MTSEVKTQKLINEYTNNKEDIDKILKFINCAKNNTNYGKLMVIHDKGNNGKTTFINKLLTEINDSKENSVNYLCSSNFVNMELLSRIQNQKLIHLIIDQYIDDNLYHLLIHILKREEIYYRKRYGKIEKIVPGFNIIIETNSIGFLHRLTDDYVDIVHFNKTF